MNTTSSPSSLSALVAEFTRVTGHGPSFVGLTYTSKSTGEVARWVMSVGVSYHNLIEKSLVELQDVPANTALEIEAKAAVKASLEKTLAAHAVGQQNADYTKLGMYSDVCKGIKRFHDGSCEVAGIIISRVVITPGVYKTVKSSALTLAKGAIERQLSKAKWRTPCVDVGNLASVRLGGTEIEVTLPLTDPATVKTVMLSVIRETVTV